MIVTNAKRVSEYACEMTIPFTIEDLKSIVALVEFNEKVHIEFDDKTFEASIYSIKAVPDELQVVFTILGEVE